MAHPDYKYRPWPQERRSAASKRMLKYLDRLEEKTREIARRHGCDKSVFTVCWGEYERGETCQCKEDARQELRKG